MRLFFTFCGHVLDGYFKYPCKGMNNKKYYNKYLVLILGINHRDNFKQIIFTKSRIGKQPLGKKYDSEHLGLLYASSIIKDRIINNNQELCNNAYGKTYAFIFTYMR